MIANEYIFLRRSQAGNEIKYCSVAYRQVITFFIFRLEKFLFPAYSVVPLYRQREYLYYKLHYLPINGKLSEARHRLENV